jgi:hypothetical protein
VRQSASGQKYRSVSLPVNVSIDRQRVTAYGIAKCDTIVKKAEELKRSLNKSVI